MDVAVVDAVPVAGRARLRSRAFPTSGNVAWANVACVHEVSDALWHFSQVVGNPAVTCAGWRVAS